jgi:cephalosporin-C deacetylase-like acetyl esterase/lysophospholipase L1-like esterase
VVAALANSAFSLSAEPQPLILSPYQASGIYEIDETVGWTASRMPGAGPQEHRYRYTIKKNNYSLIREGEIDLSDRIAKIEARVDEPAMLYLELRRADALLDARPVVAGAAVAPTKLKPVAPRPEDFDEFWDAKIKTLQTIPANPVLKPSEIGVEGIEYATIRMDHIDGSHIHGQIAKPKQAGKFPAIVIFQWASPPYPLQREWVTQRAAEGWLALNIEPHDVLPTEPPSYYQSLPETLKHYESIGNDNREKSYFLRMYLAAYRAVDYITSHPEWDGKTLVVNGISMGGQQSLCVAGLHPKVTHVIVNVPAGCDTNGPLHGRQSSYPNFPTDNRQVMRTALYFDVVNFAPRIKARSLVAMGFVDTLTAPAGIWTVFNLIQGPKEAVPMIDSPHNHLATPEQQRPYNERSAEWLNTLVKGGQVNPRLISAPRIQANADGDHQRMMDQLGIKVLRPGANPRNQEVFDERNANRFASSMPQVLHMDDGSEVKSGADWPKRRAEILEHFEREIYGRIPQNVPRISWRIDEEKKGTIAGVETVSKSLVGHVDNSAAPAIDVDIRATFTVPAETDRPVPMLILFVGNLNRAQAFARMGQRGPAPPWTEQALKSGWGFALLDAGSIQPDNAAGLRLGIIGLTNRGQLRKLDEWGALRAWQWGASRLIDYFSATPASKVDATKVGIAGLSRFGKAAVVTQAFDERVAVGLIASSGAGGAKLYRHVFGETLENLAGGEYYWMAGNIMKYAAAESTFGAKTVADLPIDSHQLIALCAPRPCFISYGTVEGGDPPWVDARGSFMAGVLATPVYNLLGKEGFGKANNYVNEQMPPVGTLVGGELTWRQHEGGHDITPNWPAFFAWAQKYVGSSQNVARGGEVPTAERADRPTPRSDANSQLAHQQLVMKARRGRIDVYFVGDSITRRWGCTDPQYRELLENWKANFYGWNAANFGWGADKTQHILWRLTSGELDGVNPKVIVILAGTNNIGDQPATERTVGESTSGIRAIVDLCRKKAPNATIILTAIFPRNDNTNVMPVIHDINSNISKLADGKKIRFVDVNRKLADERGRLFDGMMIDKLHPTVKGYQVWADALKPILTEILGPPSKTDQAPPPTGDPSLKPGQTNER